MTWLLTAIVVGWTAITLDRSAMEAERLEWDEIMGTKESDE